MSRRRFSTPARPATQKPAPLRHTLTRARSEEGWMLLERDKFEVNLNLPATWSADSLPLSSQPTIENLTRAFVLDSTDSRESDSLSSVEADAGHPTIPARTSRLEIARPSSELGSTRPTLDVEEVPRSHLDARSAPSKFVYKTPSDIIIERDCFPFQPAIMIQAPTPPPHFPLLPVLHSPSPAAITSIRSLSATSLNSLPSPIIPSTPTLPSTPLPDPTPRELAERSERIQTLGNAVMRSRAYSVLMHRHCETLGTALESAAELQEARAEIVRLKARIERYREVNSSLVDWGLRLREENDVLRAEAGEVPGVMLFDPERDIRSRDDEGYGAHEGPGEPESYRAYKARQHEGHDGYSDLEADWGRKGYGDFQAFDGHNEYEGHKGYDVYAKGYRGISWRIDEQDEHGQQEEVP
ncbi:hypothetical protein CspeluHIS016_0803050 [Cutaneotrichosporon spelunceum]|uniref:Uncharacterized protein n=1 Tax=Cutaneotrichosporon spelunceum TaxID=1672016 RepID=A0AAD3TZE8_9TREE|nr:hypothetical protein CspeluHIS016_0803050 [Cutaneotrichosporon spelunceum]